MTRPRPTPGRPPLPVSPEANPPVIKKVRLRKVTPKVFPAPRIRKYLVIGLIGGEQRWADSFWARSPAEAENRARAQVERTASAQLRVAAVLRGSEVVA